MIRNAAIAGAVALGAVGVGVGWTVQQNVFADDAVGGTVGAPAGVDLDGDGVISEDERTIPAALYFDCPGGEALGELHDGDRILTVGIHDTADGWLALRKPLEPSETVWIAAEQVVPDGETGDLPPLSCAEGQAVQVAEVAAPDDTTTTEPTSETTTSPATTATTAPDATTTTRPRGTTTTTTSTTTTTAPPPSISNVVRSPTQIIEQYDGGSCGGVNVSDIQATGANATSMTMSWAAGPQSGSVTMAKSGSTFTAAFGPFPKETIASATASIVITLDATGPGGTATRQTSVTLKNCSIG